MLRQVRSSVGSVSRVFRICMRWCLFNTPETLLKSSLRALFQVTGFSAQDYHPRRYRPRTPFGESMHTVMLLIP